MKKLLFSMALATAAITGLNAQTVLSGSVSGTLTDPCYFLDGCVTVESGNVLTIPAGTVFLGDTTVGGEGALIIKRGAKIIAQGTATNPIIFTSAKVRGNRRPGDWGGIIIIGNAPNNRTNDTFNVEGPCTPLNAGGPDADDSSGVFQYVQIHYAGVSVGGAGTGNEINSLTLAAVGRKTVIDHVQISYANDDAFEWFGGGVNTKYLISYNTRDDAFDTDFGFNGLSQFGIDLRLDTSMHDVSGSNGIESDNNNDAPNYGGDQQTRPIFSNYSLIGPMHCNNFAVNPEFKSGAHIRRNSAHSLYNSYIAGWPVNGLVIENNQTALNTFNNVLNWSHNSFADNTANLGTVGAPTPFCANSMANWINFGSNGPACREYGNLNLLNITGIGGLCVSPCATPDFTMTGTTAQNGAASFTGGPALTDLASPFFDKTVTFRGAFGSAATDWTEGWTNWCPQQQRFCNEPAEKAEGDKNTGLSLVPNPSSNVTYAVFENSATGRVKISILDKVTGSVVRVDNALITEGGAQRIAFDVAGLQPGVYTVRVETAENTFASQLMVK